MRRFVDTLVLLAAAGLIVQTWLVHGWLLPDVVANASMAPTLRGPHRQVTCPGCGLRYSCDAVADAADSRPLLAVCPNCGTQISDLAELPVRGGDRLLIDRAAWNWCSPRRWEMAVLRDPTNPSDLVVKRIVGLPGETVEIREGDIYINGQIARKTLDEFRRLAILVNRDDHRVPANEAGSGRVGPPLWYWCREGPGAWRQTPRGWQLAAKTQEPPGTKPKSEFASNALFYRRIRKVSHAWWLGGNPVLDDYAYNTGESRELQAARDLLLRFQIRASGYGTIALNLGNDCDNFSIRIDVSTGQCELMRQWSLGAEKPTNARTIDPESLHSGALVEFARFDRQICFAVQGQEVLTFPFDPMIGEDPHEHPHQFISIDASGVEAEITDLEVLRDICYLPTAGNAPAVNTVYQLGPDEYFVLGDNSPVSLDSRQWHAEGGVRREHLFGPVIAVLARNKDDR